MTDIIDMAPLRRAQLAFRAKILGDSWRFLAILGGSWRFLRDSLGGCGSNETPAARGVVGGNSALLVTYQDKLIDLKLAISK